MKARRTITVQCQDGFDSAVLLADTDTVWALTYRPQPKRTITHKPTGCSLPEHIHPSKHNLGILASVWPNFAKHLAPRTTLHEAGRSTEIDAFVDWLLTVWPRSLDPDSWEGQ